MAHDGASRLKSFEAALTHQEEGALARAWRQRGDVEARNRLISAHRGFAYSCARNFSRGRGDIEDLRQEAVLGLMDAADRFDPDLGWRFSTYAAWWIRSRISNSIVDGHAPVKVNSGVFRKLYFALGKATRQVELDLGAAGGSPPPALVRQEVARRLKVSVEDLERYAPMVSLKTRSLDEPVGAVEHGGDVRTLADLVLGSVQPAEHDMAEAEARDRILALLEDALARLCERDRDIIRARWLDPDKRATLEDMSERHGISREGVRQIELRCFARIARHLSLQSDFAQLFPVPEEKRSAARAGRCIRKIRKP